MPGVTGALLGGALAGGLSGAGGSSSSQSMSRPGATDDEMALQKNAFNSYFANLDNVRAQENAVGQGAGVQQGARDQLQNIFNGTAYDVTPQMQQQIDNVRNANIQAGAGDINNFVQQSLQGVNSSAADRGVRGQALGQAQGTAVAEGARQFGNLVGQANATAAQQAMDNPYRQAQLSGGLANQNANFMENLRQQAITNRSNLANPALLGYYQNERSGNATQTSNTPGSLGSTLGGALGGAGSFAGGYGNLLRGQAAINQYPGKAHGGFIDGISTMRGDHAANDTVPVRLSPGELVIPKSHAHDAKLAKAFVDYMFKDHKKGAA